jgi:putative DNA primase/helicase
MSHWVEVEPRTVRSLLYAFTEHAIYPSGRTFASWAPTRKKVGDLLEALSAIVILSDEIEQPCWTGARNNCGVIVAVANGLLDITSRELYRHTPAYFNQTSVPFDYDLLAPDPKEWLAFVRGLWPAETEAIHVLSEWFGYVISGRLDLHKILLMVGPTRGGKGVIARTLTALIGKENVAGPTLNSLGGDFGLAPLIGKPLAIISDARFVGKTVTSWSRGYCRSPVRTRLQSIGNIVINGLASCRRVCMSLAMNCRNSATPRRRWWVASSCCRSLNHGSAARITS